MDGKVSRSGGLTVRAEYPSIMKAKTNWYYQQNKNKQIVIISTQNIVHPCLEVSVIKYVVVIPAIIFNKKQTLKYLQRQKNCIAGGNRDYILDEIMCRDHIEYER